MDWAEARRELRQSRLDDSVAGELWSDEELLSFYNDSIRQWCMRTRCLIDSTTPAVCQRPVVAGQQSIRLHPSILAVRMVTPATGCEDLTGWTAKRVSRERPRWHLPDPSDTAGPEFWIPDWQDGWLWFDRPFQAPTTLHLSVWRVPTDAEQIESDGDEPPIPLAHHVDLLDWCEYRAYSKRDAETVDNARADRALMVFEAKAGRLPTAAEMRLWGVQRHRGVGVHWT